MDNFQNNVLWREMWALTGKYKVITQQTVHKIWPVDMNGKESSIEGFNQGKTWLKHLSSLHMHLVTIIFMWEQWNRQSAVPETGQGQTGPCFLPDSISLSSQDPVTNSLSLLIWLRKPSLQTQALLVFSFCSLLLPLTWVQHSLLLKRK